MARLVCSSLLDISSTSMVLVVCLNHVLLSMAYGHGSMLFPNQRGALSPKAPYVVNPIPQNRRTPIDHWMHFPAGHKSSAPEAGKKSLIRAAGPQGWTVYNPYDKNFRWRASPCGDILGNRDHLKGGKYYNNAARAATFDQGAVIDVQMGVVAHHNGFIELHLCDRSKCPGGDISPECFQLGHCIQLKRAGNDACEDRMNPYCSPVDPNYPGRWYLPCRSVGKPMRGTYGDEWLLYGPGTIRYQLPSHFYCEYCVIQWYWTSANNCNPPGVVEYFTGNRSPLNWKNCPGQAGAIGGFTRVQKPCGGPSQFPEEYYQCSDIKIRQRRT